MSHEFPIERITLPQHMLMTKPITYIQLDYVCLSISETRRCSCIEEVFGNDRSASKRAWTYVDSAPVSILHGDRLTPSNPHRMWWLVIRRSYDIGQEKFQKGMKSPREGYDGEVVGGPGKRQRTVEPLVLKQVSERNSSKRPRNDEKEKKNSLMINHKRRGAGSAATDKITIIVDDFI